MLLDVLPRLHAVRLVLASGSPRRVEMLRGAGLDRLEVVPSCFAESLDKASFASAAAYALATARGKAEEVLARLEASEAAGADAAPCLPLVLIACDTVVEAPSGEVLEKPRDRADAARMLRALSGAPHRVHSGVVLLGRGGKVLDSFTQTTAVVFAALPESLVLAHSASDEDLDKAGAYAIQGRAAAFVARVEGDVSSVIGLPLQRVCAALRAIALAL
jgi:septum formation protein